MNGEEIEIGTGWVINLKGGDTMNMRKALEHTRMRFNSMTERQLWNRMGATTTKNKIIAFAQIAEERNMFAIAAAANARLKELYGIDHTPKAKSTVLETAKKEKLLRRMDAI